MSPVTPNFFLVGASKSGTTFLAAALGTNAAVYSPVRKEFHYFSSDLNCAGLRIESYPRYLQYFSGANTYRWRIDASPSYLYSGVAAAGIATAFPDARISIVLRNPVKRAYSMYLHNRLRGYEPLEFEEALEAEQKRIEDGWPWGFHYQRSGMYSAQVKRYLEVFPEAQIRLFFAEDLFSSPEMVVSTIFRWLEVDGDWSIPAGGTNRTGVARSKLFAKLISPRAKSILGLSQRMPDWILSVRRRLVEWNVRTAPPLSSETEARLKDLFAADVDELSTLIGSSPEWW